MRPLSWLQRHALTNIACSLSLCLSRAQGAAAKREKGAAMNSGVVAAAARLLAITAPHWSDIQQDGGGDGARPPVLTQLGEVMHAYLSARAGVPTAEAFRAAAGGLIGVLVGYCGGKDDQRDVAALCAVLNDVGAGSTGRRVATFIAAALRSLDGDGALAVIGLLGVLLSKHERAGDGGVSVNAGPFLHAMLFGFKPDGVPSEDRDALAGLRSLLHVMGAWRARGDVPEAGMQLLLRLSRVRSLAPALCAGLAELRGYVTVGGEALEHARDADAHAALVALSLLEALVIDLRVRGGGGAELALAALAEHDELVLALADLNSEAAPGIAQRRTATLLGVLLSHPNARALLAGYKLRHRDDDGRLSCLALTYVTDSAASLVTCSRTYYCDGRGVSDGLDVACADESNYGLFLGVRQCCRACDMDMCEPCVAAGRWEAKHREDGGKPHAILRLGSRPFEVGLPIAPVAHARDRDPRLHWTRDGLAPESPGVLALVAGRAAAAEAAPAPGGARAAAPRPAAPPVPPGGGAGTMYKEGMLMKAGGATKTWHARWCCIVAGPQFLYFVSKEDAAAVRVCVGGGSGVTPDCGVHCCRSET